MLEVEKEPLMTPLSRMESDAVELHPPSVVTSTRITSLLLNKPWLSVMEFVAEGPLMTNPFT